MEQNINPGTYQAKVTHYSMGESEKGTPYVQVAFEIQDQEFTKEIKWWGYLTEAATTRTLKALVTLGFTGSDPLDLADASKGNLLSSAPVEIVIDNETYDGRTRAKVQWINSLANRLTPAQVKVKLGAMNLKAQMAAIRAEMGVKSPVKTTVADPISEEPLPF